MQCLLLRDGLFAVRRSIQSFQVIRQECQNWKRNVLSFCCGIYQSISWRLHTENVYLGK